MLRIRFLRVRDPGAGCLQQHRTLSVALAYAKDEYRVDYGVMSAAIMFAVMPMLAAYLFLKERITSGTAAGAVKG